MPEPLLGMFSHFASTDKMRYPCRSTLDDKPARCEFCGRSWSVIVSMLKKYKTWARMPDCPARPKDQNA